MTESARVEVRDNYAESRYDLFVDGELAGFAVYRLAPERRIFVHTEVFDAFEGHGYGTILAKGALDDVRAHGQHMTPQCPFIAAFVEHHPDYVDLVDEAHRARFS